MQSFNALRSASQFINCGVSTLRHGIRDNCHAPRGAMQCSSPHCKRHSKSKNMCHCEPVRSFNSLRSAPQFINCGVSTITHGRKDNCHAPRGAMQCSPPHYKRHGKSKKCVIANQSADWCGNPFFQFVTVCFAVLRLHCLDHTSGKRDTCHAPAGSCRVSD